MSVKSSADGATRAAAPRLATFALAGVLLAGGAAQAQSVVVRIQGRSEAAVRSDIVRAAVRVCRQSDHSPLAPIAEDGCVEDTIALTMRRVADARQHDSELSVAAPSTAPRPQDR